jgi:hypothetical protein
MRADDILQRSRGIAPALRGDVLRPQSPSPGLLEFPIIDEPGRP